MAETTGIINFLGRDRGLSKVIDVSGKNFKLLSDRVIEGTDSLGDYNQNLNLVQRSLDATGKSVFKTARSVGEFYGNTSSAFNKTTDAAGRTIDVAEALDNRFVGLTARVLGVNKPFGALNDILQPTAGFFGEVSDQSTAFGKAAVVLNTVVRPMTNSLKIAASVTEGLGDRLAGLGPVGEAASKTVLQLASTFGILSKSLGYADVVGDVYLMAGRLKEFAEEVVPATIDTTKTLGSVFESTGLKSSLFGDRIKTATTLSKVFQNSQNETAKALSRSFLAFNEINGKIELLKKLGQAATDAFIETKNLGETLGTFEAIGVDTTFAKMAVEIAGFGKSLLTSAEAAQKFITVTISAFAQLEDQLAVVRTLSSGASVDMGELGGAMTDLVNGPLKNTITSTEAAAALYNSLSAGVGVTSEGFAQLNRSTSFLEAGLKLAAGTGTDATQTIEALAKVNRVYDISTRDAAESAAKMNAIVEQGIVTFPQLVGNLSGVASVAKSSGVGIDELYGSIAALTNVMSADDAMTGYTSLLQAIAGQGDQASQAVASLGIRFDSQSVKMKGLLANLDELWKATGGSTEKLKEIIPDSLAFRTALNLMTVSARDARDMTENMGNVGAESLDKVFNRRQQSLIKEASNLMNGFREIMVDLGSRVLPILEPGISFLQDILEGLQRMPEPVKDLIGTMIFMNVALNNTLGIGRSFIGLLVQMASQILIARAAKLLFTGTLFQEIGAIKQLVTVDKDYAGALLQVFGFQQKSALAAKELIALNESQAKSQKVINTLFGTSSEKLKDNAQAYEEALQSVRNLREQTANVPRSALGASNLLPSREELTKAEKQIQDTLAKLAKAQVSGAQSGAAAGAESMVSGIPDNVIANKSRIDEAFERLFSEAPKVKEKLLDTKDQLELAITEIMNGSEGDIKQKGIKLTQAFSSIFSEVGPTVKEKRPDLIAAIQELLEGIDKPIEERKEEFSKKIEDLFSVGTPDEQKQGEAIKDYVNGLVDSAEKQAKTTEFVTSAQQALGNETQRVTAATTLNTRATQANAASQSFLGRINTGLAASRVLDLKSLLNLRQATILDTVGTRSNAAAKMNLAQIQLLTRTSTDVLSAAMLKNTTISRGQLLQMRLAAGGQRVLAGAQAAAAAGTGLFTGAIRLGTAAVQAFWASIGPIGLAIAALGAAFAILQDLVPALGGAAGQAQEMADGLRKITDESNAAAGAQESLTENTREYSGFITTKLIPAVKGVLELVTGAWITRGMNSLIKNATGGAVHIDGVFQAIDNGFTNAKDSVQDFINAPVWEELQKTDVVIQERFATTLRRATNLKAGDFMTARAKQLQEQAAQARRAMTGDEMKEALGAEEEALKSNREENERNVAALEELKNKTSDPELKAAFQSRIDQINQSTTALEEAQSAQQKYIQNLNAIAVAMEENDAAKSSERVAELLKQRTAEALKSVPEALKGQYEQIFTDLDKNMSLASTAQRRQAVQLISATRDFVDNVGGAASITDQQDLNKLREDANAFLERIGTAEAAGTLSKEFANQLRQQLLNQEIEIPGLNFKGSILSSDQIESINKQIDDSDTALAERRVTTFQNAIDRMKTLSAQHGINAEEANIKILENDILISQERLAVQEKLLEDYRVRYSENSEQFRQQQQVVLQLQNEAAQKQASLEDAIFEQQMKRRERQVENQTKIVVQGFQKQLNAIDTGAKELELQVSLLQSYQSLLNAINSLEDSRVQNQLRVTDDAQAKAILETEMAQKRLANLDRTQKAEQQTALLQAEINRMAAEREVINNKIAQAENQRAISMARIERIAAVREKRTQEELDAMDLEIAALNEQGTQLVNQAGLLERSREQQEQITENTRVEMEYRNQQAREGGMLDLQIAKQQEITASVEARGKIENQFMDAIAQKLDFQAKVIESRKESLESLNSLIQGQFQILIDSAKSERERKKLAEDAAKVRLAMLERTQELERQNLEIQIEQADIALERLKIENETARVKNQAETETAAAALEDVQERYDRGEASDRELRAAELGLTSKLREGAGLAYTGELLNRQDQLNDRQARNQRENMSMQQDLARSQARMDVAQNTRNPTRRRELMRDVREDIGGRSGSYEYGGYGGSLGRALSRAGAADAGQMPQLPSFEQFMQQFMARGMEYLGAGSKTPVPVLATPQADLQRRSSNRMPTQAPEITSPGLRRPDGSPQASPALPESASYIIQIESMQFEVTVEAAEVENPKEYGQIVRREMQNGLRDLILEARNQN